MQIIKLSDLSEKDYQRIIRRSFGADKNVVPQVKKIMDKVRTYGDKVILKKYQKRYGSGNYKSIQVSNDEIKKAYKNVNKKFIQSINQMIRNITQVHRVQLSGKTDTIVSPEKGITVWREWRAIEKVGLYIPGGKAVYPSSVLMTAIPAKIAGCKEIVMCSPAKEDGQIPYPTVVAADMIGIKKIYKVGGAEAIAAMAYGTETIPKVYKVFGAGNSYITVAKMLALEEIAIDMPAGPSEVMILADETANHVFVAADILADAEHGPDSACIILTIKSQNYAIAKRCAEEIERQIENLFTKKRIRESLDMYGLILEADTVEEAIKFINVYAPEHLEIMVKNPERLIDKIQNAGSVFLGNWTAKSAGDYANGANHVLPTGGAAKMYPPLGVDSFGKWMQVQKCTKEGLKNIKNTIETIAEVELLPAHKNATTIRFKKIIGK